MYAFDTLSYARRLKEAGVPEAQAEAHAEAARTFIMGELVTRHDLEVIAQGFRHDLEGTAQAFRRDLEGTAQAVRHDLEVTTQAFRRDLEGTKDELRRDLEGTRDELRRDLTELRQDQGVLRRELEAKIDHQTLRLTLRLGLLLAAGIAVLATILRIG